MRYNIIGGKYPYTNSAKKGVIMLKRMLCLMLALILCCASAMAAEDESSALTLDELNAWVAGYKARAMESAPYNNPAAAESYSEDGYEFIYDFATLYMDRPEMTAESVVRALVITSSLEEGPRGTRVDDFSSDVLNAFYCENEQLAGDRSFAALYLSDAMPSGARWAWVQRDGQRLQAIQYAVHEQLATGGDGYTDAGLVYTIQDDFVSAIRAYGLDARVPEETVHANISSVKEVAAAGSYHQVPLSYAGEMDVFGREDLVFSGVDFLTITPESAMAALGSPLEDLWVQDDNGEHLRTMEFAACTVTFIYDAQKQHAVPYMLMISRDGMEGPRAVRVGDTFASVMNRFRHGEGQFDGVSSESLYGTVGGAQWGAAEYGANADATLRYAVQAEDGRTVVLHMTFAMMALDEIMLYVAE